MTIKKYYGYINRIGKSMKILRLLSEGYELYVHRDTPIYGCVEGDFLLFNAELERKDGFTLHLKNPVNIQIMCGDGEW